MAFARIAAAWDSEDQTIHTTRRRMIWRRDGSQPVVKAFSIDANWTAVDPSLLVLLPSFIVMMNILIVPSLPQERTCLLHHFGIRRTSYAKRRCLEKIR